MKFKEIEFKYQKNELGLLKVKKIFEEFPIKKFLEVGSWDHYYTDPANKDQFIRDRSGSTSAKRELTSKAKTVASNNVERTEINLSRKSDIDTYNSFLKMIGMDKGSLLKEPSNAAIELTVDLDKVLSDAKEKGYWFNFQIYKMCWIYWLKNNVVLVYYICYNEDFKEVGRFIEVEADPEEEWESEEVALTAIKEVEKKLDSIGVTFNHRLDKSLYELFRKERP